MTYTHHPRFGSNYRGLTNRLDLLLECYSYLPFAERVRTTYATLLEALRYVAAHATTSCRSSRRAARRAIEIAVRYTARRVRRADRDPDAHAAHARRRAVERARALLRATSSARPSSIGRAAYLVPTRASRRTSRATASPSSRRPASIDAEVATVVGFGDRGRPQDPRVGAGRRPPGRVAARGARTVPPARRVVRTDQPLGAIAVYLCEPESDDGAIENGLVAAPDLGGEFPIWRVTE